MGANKPATSAIFVLKPIAPTGRSYLWLLTRLIKVD
jgi:hypothetical protein